MTKPFKARDFDPGRRVLYVPTHAHGDINHKDVERGTVVRTNPATVFVLFDGESTPKGCYPQDLQFDHTDWKDPSALTRPA